MTRKDETQHLVQFGMPLEEELVTIQAGKKESSKI